MNSIAMEPKIRHLGDSSNTTETLLTLPRSDFPQSKNHAAGILSEAPNSSDDEEDRLVLVRLPSKSVTVEDLQSQNVYILGDTSEYDIDHSSGANGHTSMDNEEKGQDANIHVPISARLIVEGKSNSGQNNEGKTLELMRIETSNTCILVPPMPIVNGNDSNGAISEDDPGSNKRQKTDSSDKNKQLTTMPARSVGLVPGEESPACFFLEPVHLKPGHYAAKLRWALSRWVYDPLDPPEGKFGYSLSDLAHICRTSESEIQYALHKRVFGAEDALLIPGDGASSLHEKMYGILSEEGRQTVSMAILSALLESDVDVPWYFSDENKSEKGMELSPLMNDVRTQWHNLEEDGVITSKESQNAPILTDSKLESQNDSQSQFFTPAEFHKLKAGNRESVLANEIIWHCLRPMVSYPDGGNKDSTPKTIWLIPDEVAKLAAHNVFLRGSSSNGWRESEFTLAWNMRMPSISKYEPNVELLQGIALSDLKADGDGENYKVWQYFPEAALPLVPSLRVKSMFAMCSEWTLIDAIPYLSKFVTVDGASNDDVESEVKNLLQKYAKAVSNGDKNGGGAERTKYVLSTK